MTDQDFKRFEQIVFDFTEEVKAEFRHQIGIQTEFYQQKLDILVEGHRMLADKIDRWAARLDQQMDCRKHKLDAVAADLTAHRADTEAHPPIFRINE